MNRESLRGPDRKKKIKDREIECSRGHNTEGKLFKPKVKTRLC